MKVYHDKDGCCTSMMKEVIMQIQRKAKFIYPNWTYEPLHINVKLGNAYKPVKEILRALMQTTYTKEKEKEKIL